MRFRFKAISSALVVGALVLGILGFSTNSKVNADIPEVPSEKLVVICQDESLIPGEKIVASSEDAFLLDYNSESEALEAFCEFKREGLPVSYETVFSVADGEFREFNESALLPRETEVALDMLDIQKNETTDFENRRVIALIDTGATPGDATEIFSVLGDEGYDYNGHGTKMTGAIREINPQADIVSIKALTDSGIGSISSVYSAIMLAVEKGVSIINLSIVARSVSENEIIAQAIESALSKNIVVVGAAGNSGEDVSGYLPGCISSVITVGAADSEGKRQSFSNYGDLVDWNVTANSTSEASAKLSGFISRYCENNASLNGVISGEMGKGLIWPVNYEPVKPEGYRDDQDEFNIGRIDDWQEAEFNREEMNKAFEIDEKYQEIVSMRQSPKTGLVELTTMDYSVPRDGSFTAAWNFASTITRAYYVSPGVVDVGFSDGNEVPVANTIKDGGWVSYTTTSTVKGWNVVGLSMFYNPGSFEQSPEAVKVYGAAAKASDLKYKLFYRDGTESVVGNGSGTEIHHPNPMGQNSYVTKVQVYFDGKAAANLYRTCLRLSANNVVGRSHILNFGSYSEGDISYVIYESGYVNQRDTVGSIDTPWHRIDFNIRLRGIAVYYKIGDDQDALYRADVKPVGSTFDFASYENTVKSKINFSGKTFIGWDYSAFGNKERPSSSLAIFPANGTPEIMLANNSSGYQYTTGASYANIPAPYFKYVIEPKTNPKITYQARTLNRKTGVWTPSELANTENNPTECTEATSVTLKNPAAATGYEFLGWVEGEASKVTATAGNTTFVLNGAGKTDSFTMTALFAQKEYRITYNLADSNGSSRAVNDIRNPDKYVVEDTVVVYPPTRKGYEFTGWSGSVTSKGEDNVTIAGNRMEDIGITAGWSPITYTVEFSGNGASGQMQAIEVPYDGSVTFPECDFNRDGYEFLGYDRNPDSSEAEFHPGDLIDNISDKNGDNIVFYPIYKKILGRAYLNLIYEGSSLPVTDFCFNLEKEDGTVVMENLKTDESGSISVSDLDWEENGTSYVFVAVKTEPGFETVRDAAFTVNAQNVNKIHENHRIMYMERGEITIETNSFGSIYAPVFAYRIRGVDVSGKERVYNLMVKGNEITKACIKTLSLPKGEYTLTSNPISGYSQTGVEAMEGFVIGEEGASINLLENETGRIRYTFSIDDSKRAGLDLKVNSLKG